MLSLKRSGQFLPGLNCDNNKSLSAKYKILDHDVYILMDILTLPVTYFFWKLVMYCIIRAVNILVEQMNWIILNCSCWRSTHYSNRLHVSVTICGCYEDVSVNSKFFASRMFSMDPWSKWFYLIVTCCFLAHSSELFYMLVIFVFFFVLYCDLLQWLSRLVQSES